MNKRIVSFLGSSLLLFAAASATAGELSGNVSLATDYVWRGYSQTNEGPAVSGGFDYSDDSGLYAGVWGSNIEFAGTLESDWYFGYSGKVNDDFTYDVGYIYYYYPHQEDLDGPGAADASFSEINGNIGYKGFSAGFAYSNDFTYESGSGLYLQAGYDLSLPNDFGIGFHVGKTKVDDINLDYVDYSIGLSKSAAGLDFSLTYYDTSDCSSAICDSRVVFGVGKSL